MLSYYASLRSEFRVVMSVTISTMFRSSLHPAVCRRAHVLFTLFVFLCIFNVMVSSTHCVVFFALFVFVLCT